MVKIYNNDKHIDIKMHENTIIKKYNFQPLKIL